MSRLTNVDRRAIDRARQLADAGDLRQVREAAADPGLSTYAEAFGVARVGLSDLLAIIGRLERLDSGPGLVCPGCGSKDVDLGRGLLCGACAETTAGEGGDGPAPLIGYLIDGKLWHPSDVTIVRSPDAGG